jgi:hypothetical protein
MSRPSRAWRLALGCGAALCAVGCAHGPHVRYDAAAHALCVERRECLQPGRLGGDWTLVRRGETDIGYYSARAGSVIQLNATCRDDAEAAPLTTLTNHLLIGYTDRRILTQEERALVGRAALHTVVEGELDGVAVTLDLYVVKRDGCIFDLSLAGPTARYPAGRGAFADFVGGLRPLGRS